jgi:hypothetical protein
MTPEPVVIDCSTCVLEGTSACEDCVVTFVCGRDPDEAVVLNVAEARTVRLLGDAGLVPRNRHVSRTG